MKWATRARVHVDRAACARLIRRFIDPQAEFVFIDDPADVPPDATGFDMRGVPLSHHEGRCTFETALLQYDLSADTALEEIGHIVQEPTSPTKPSTPPSPPDSTPSSAG